MTDKTSSGPARQGSTERCTCGHTKRDHSGRRDHREKGYRGQPWCHACEAECIYCPPDPDDPGPEGTDTCLPVEIDGETIRVRGGAEMSDESQAALTEVIRAARQRMISEQRAALAKYPYQDGETTVLGPEIFASSDGAVICWKGENYVRQPEPAPAAGFTAGNWASSPSHRLTSAPVTPEMEHAATERARQAAAESERAAEWLTAGNTPATTTKYEDQLRERLERRHVEAAQMSGQIGDLKRELADERERAEEAERRRDQLVAAIDRVLAAGHPPLGTSILRWWDKRLAELRAALEPPKTDQS